MTTFTRRELFRLAMALPIAGVFFAFDAEKGQMTITRPGGTRVFTKEK